MSAPIALRCQPCLAAVIFEPGAEHGCTGITSHAHVDGGITQIKVADCPCPCQALALAGEGVLVCFRCQGAIGAGEPYRRHDIHSCSGPGFTVRQHVVCPSEPRS